MGSDSGPYDSVYLYFLKTGSIHVRQQQQHHHHQLPNFFFPNKTFQETDYLVRNRIVNCLFFRSHTAHLTSYLYSLWQYDRYKFFLSFVRSFFLYVFRLHCHCHCHCHCRCCYHQMNLSICARKKFLNDERTQRASHASMGTFNFSNNWWSFQFFMIIMKILWRKYIQYCRQLPLSVATG